MTIPELRAQIGNQLGFGSIFGAFEGSAASYSALSADDQVRLTNAMKAYIRDHPADFTTAQKQVAASPDIGAIDPYTWADAVGDFTAEVADQAVDLNETLNPFSARNRGYVLAAVAIGLVLYFAGPAIIQALRKPAK